jgi:hypothetical protein
MYRLNADVFRSSGLIYWISSDCVHRRVDSLRTPLFRFYRNVGNIFSIGITSFLFTWCAFPLSYAALFIQHYSYFSACPLHQVQGPNSSSFSSTSILILLPLKQHLFRLVSPRLVFFSFDTGNLTGLALDNPPDGLGNSQLISYFNSHVVRSKLMTSLISYRPPCVMLCRIVAKW